MLFLPKEQTESGSGLPGMFCCSSTEFDPDLFAAGKQIGAPAKFTENEKRTLDHHLRSEDIVGSVYHRVNSNLGNTKIKKN